MLVVFGSIIVFIVPLASASKVEARVASARTNAPAPVAAAPATNEAAPVKFPDIRVQGIIFRNTNPSAIVDGKAVFVGDYIEGALVAEIDRTSLTLSIGAERQIYGLEK